MSDNTITTENSPSTTATKTLPSTIEEEQQQHPDAVQNMTTTFNKHNNIDKTNEDSLEKNSQRRNSQFKNSYEAMTTNQNPDTPTKKTGFLTQFSGRTRFVLIICSMANFLACCAFSLPAPFYPLVAEKKGMSLTVIGFVFSVFQLVVFLVSPIIGKYMPVIGTKFVYLSGIFVGGSCVILFGLLDRCPNGTPFIVMSIVCRCIEALGCAGFMTASFTIVSHECRNAIGTAYAVLETAAGLGYMVGPAIGGALYEAGGYGLPFYVMGAMILGNGVIIYRYLPKPKNIERKEQRSMIKLLRSPLLVVALMNILVAQTAITVFDSTFAKQLEQFGLSAAIIGLIFIIPAGLYAIVAPLWGYLADNKDYPKTLIIIGNFFFAIGYLFMGPSSLLPFLPKTLWVIVIGLVLIGLSYGMMLIPSMSLMIVGAYELNYEPTMDTYALVSGLFNSVNSFGSFLGPMLGGAIVQKYGHGVGYTSVSFVSLFAMIVGSIYFLLRYHRRKGETENESEVGVVTDENDKETSALLLRRASNISGDGSNWTKARRGSTRRGSVQHLHLSLSRSIATPDSGQ